MPNYIRHYDQGNVEAWSLSSEYAVDWTFIEFPIGEVDGRTGTPPTIEPGSGYYLFSGSTANSLYGSIHLPSALDLNGDFIPAVKWTKTTSASGGVSWSLQLRAVNPGGVLGSYQAPVFATLSDDFQDDDTADKYAVSMWPTKDIDEGVTLLNDSLGQIVNFILKREPGDAGDTYGANARLLAFGVFCQIDTLGSEGMFAK